MFELFFVIFLKLKAKLRQVGKSPKKIVLTLQLKRLKVITRMVRILFITKDESCAKFQDCFIIRTLLHAWTVKKARNQNKTKGLKIHFNFEYLNDVMLVTWEN